MRHMPPLSCSFCGKDHNEVASLISAPKERNTRACICDKCVGSCLEIFRESGIALDVDSVNAKPADKAAKHIPSQLDLSMLGIKPPFKTYKFNLKPDQCFHLCPFCSPFNEIYYDHVASAARSAGLSIERADEIFGAGSIIEDIWQRIGAAELITADVTGRNPNVMYEIGMAHTLGKPVVIMTQTMDDVPFDLRQYRCLVYKFTPRGCSELEKNLLSTFQAIKSKGGSVM